MMDPRRLRETHATELEGRLLDAVRADTPPPSARARTLAAIAVGAAAGGAAVGTSGSAAAAALPGGKVGWVLAAKWLAIGAGAGAVVAGTLVGPLRGVMEREPAAVHVYTGDGAQHAVATPRAQVVAAPIAAPVVPPAVRAVEAAPAAEARFAGARVAPAERTATAPSPPTARASDATPSPSSAIASTSTLPEEVAFLDAAARALREHDAVRAHAALDSYAARFRGGNLGPEATALRIQAFLEQGDHVHAERIAENFLAQNPHSPHAARVRSLLGIRLSP